MFLHCRITKIGRWPTPDTDLEPARITAVGVGPLGMRMAGVLSSIMEGVLYYEVAYEPERKHVADIKSFFLTVRKSDLLFVLTEFDDYFTESIALVIAKAAHDEGVLTVCVTPEYDFLHGLFLQGKAQAWDFDSLVLVPRTSLPDGYIPFVRQSHRQETLAENAMLHTVAGITQLIFQRCLIGVDFFDIASVMRVGGSGRLGVGTAAGADKGGTATRSALERLAEQGVRIIDATGVLVCVCGSFQLSMDTFSEVSEAVNDAFPEPTNILVGPAVDDRMGDTVCVSIYILRKQVV